MRTARARIVISEGDRQLLIAAAAKNYLQIKMSRVQFFDHRVSNDRVLGSCFDKVRVRVLDPPITRASTSTVLGSKNPPEYSHVEYEYEYSGHLYLQSIDCKRL